MSQTAELNRQFGIAGVAELAEGHGGLTKVVINSAVQGEIYLHGAHVTSWTPTDSREVIFMSRHSVFQDGKAIRGGIPICFPWFGPHPSNAGAPAHGFARTRAWQLQSIEKNGDAVTVTLELNADEDTRKFWPANFLLQHRVTFAQQLTLELILTNAGTETLMYESALHTYYRVGDVSKVRIEGLDGVHYFDKADNSEEKIQHGSVTIAGETDRVYLDTPGEIDVIDPVLRRRINVRKQNSMSTVVWNPWIAKAKALSDLGETAWPNMLCVEVCNVGPFAVEIAPGQQHTMAAITRVFAL